MERDPGLEFAFAIAAEVDGEPLEADDAVVEDIARAFAHPRREFDHARRHRFDLAGQIHVTRRRVHQPDLSLPEG